MPQNRTCSTLFSLKFKLISHTSDLAFRPLKGGHSGGFDRKGSYVSPIYQPDTGEGHLLHLVITAIASTAQKKFKTTQV